MQSEPARNDIVALDRCRPMTPNCPEKRPDNGNSTQAEREGHRVSPYKCHSTPCFRITEYEAAMSSGAMKASSSHPIKATIGCSEQAGKIGKCALSQIGRK